MQGGMELLPGSVLDGRFCVSARLGLVAGRPRYAAFDLIEQTEVEVVLAPGPEGSRRGYHVRPRLGGADDADAMAASDGGDGALVRALDSARKDGSGGGTAAALKRFSDRVTLLGVSVSEGERLVYSAIDRQTGRAVRVVIEPVAEPAVDEAA